MKKSEKTFVEGTKLRVVVGSYKLSTLPADWDRANELEAYDGNLNTAYLFTKGTVVTVFKPGAIVEAVKIKKEGGKMIYFKAEDGLIYKSFYGLFRTLTELV